MKIAYNLTLDNITEASGGQVIISGDGTNPLVFNEIFTDSREDFSKNAVFIAIKGERFNGEDFIATVFKKGAACAIVSWNFLERENISSFGDKIIIAVNDTTEALGNIAKLYRSLFSPKKRIVITGSSGKTTTKEMVYKILSDKLGKEKILKNEFNFNNLIGVPKALLGLNEKHEIVVMEIGTNKKGEIKRLSEIISPNVAAITNIGKSHLLEFKNLRGVFEEKTSLIENLEKNSYLIINGDDKMLAKLSAINTINTDILSFAVSDGSEVKSDHADMLVIKRGVSDNKTEIEIDYVGKKYNAAVPFEGIHLLSDMSCAILAAAVCGAEPEEAIKSLEKFSLPKGRMEVLKNLPEEYILINDSYNSNPDSLKAALNTIKTYYADRRKILVLGDMLELGDSSEPEHYNAGLEAAGIADYIFYKGHYYNNFKEGLSEAGFNIDNLFFFEDTDLFKQKFEQIDKKNSVILVKASRGMSLEKYFDGLIMGGGYGKH